ncbi:DNA helicase [Helicobacter sp. NHP19-003]|uniref:DNA 3'-5' helicase n=1 Tax=Helicobacter gastrocanis TaxID=2849641 RepID=A0ABM7SBX3_9HELI|nr:ATP-dependent helicase [Helicobacter sp. NHP19-003]BCZ17880.1 DNA helicase [Helicobacter sp. NHP19-003]
MGLNPEQLQATQAPLGANLVIASAGTGKTSTIVGRILHLLESGIDPKKILLLTFTNKASQEMKARLAQHTSKAAFIEAGTFHAIAYRHLTTLDPTLCLKQPREMQTLLKSVLEQDHSIKEDCAYGASHLYDLYSYYLNAQSQQSFGDWLLDRNAKQADYIERYECALELFSELKKEQNYVDYNDLLLRYKDTMANKPPAFIEVLCDEYQDTNPLQDAVLDALRPQSLFCVGDYDQSIYAFNGADISIISNFSTKYKQAQVFTLQKNYRSSRAILNLANKVIAHNPRIYPKQLEVVKTTNPSTPTLLQYNELFGQYKGIAAHIARGGGFEEVAILFRNNSSAEGCEAALRELGVPSRRKGGVGFFDTKEVKLLLDICAFLSYSKDMMATMQVLGYGSGIGNALAKDLYLALQILGDGNSLQGLLKPNNKNPYPQVKRPQMGLFESIVPLAAPNHQVSGAFKNHPLLTHPKLTQAAASFLDQLYTLCKTHTPKLPAQSLVHIAQSVWFQEIATSLAKERAKTKDGHIDKNLYESAQVKIKQRVDLSVQLATSYKNLRDFLHAMVLGSKEMASGSGVQLLSVHASKGLEFGTVYVIDLMEGRFPNTKLAKQSGSLEEERRLFYVAVTRAKDHLYLSYAKEDKMKKAAYQPSRFLMEAGLLTSKNC